MIVYLYYMCTDYCIPFLFSLVFNKIFTSYCFVEDVNSWMRGTHEFHENWATTNCNDSTVFKQWIVLFRKKLRRCVHTNQKTRVSALWKFVCTHRCSYETTSFKKEQSIAYIYILETFPTTHINLFWSLFMWVAINGTACWTALSL